VKEIRGFLKGRPTLGVLYPKTPNAECLPLCISSIDLSNFSVLFMLCALVDVEPWLRPVELIAIKY
jgi:hypothetical protein